MRPLRLGIAVVLGVLLPACASAAAGPPREHLAYGTFPVEGTHLVAVFDDGAQADQAYLRYVVTVVDATDAAAHVHVDVALHVGSADPQGPHVRYFGRAHVEAAQRGDYSFIRRLDASRLDLANASISPDDSLPGTRPTVEIPGEMVLTRSLDATVDLDEGAVCWDDAPGACGVWALWTPRAGGAPLVRYLPDAAQGSYGTYNASSSPPSAALVSRLAPGLREWTLWFGLGTARGMPGWEDHPLNVTLGNVYDPRDGSLLGLATLEFMDDTLHHALGLVYYRAAALTRMDAPRDAPAFPAWACVGALAGLAAASRRRA